MTPQNLTNFSETLTSSSQKWRLISRLSSMSILGLALPALGLSFAFALLLSNPVQAQTQLNSAEKIKQIRGLMVPAIEQATDWGLKVGLGLVSASAFYALVVRVIKL